MAPMAPARPPTIACLREFGMLIRSEDGVSVARDPTLVGVVRLELVDVLEMEVKLEVGAKEKEAPIGSYDKTSVVDEETEVEVLDVVGILKENSGQSLVEVAGSEVDMSCDDQVVVDAEEEDSCDVEGVDTDVSKEEANVVESETVSKVGVDVGGFPTGAADTGDSLVAELEACPESADSSFWAS